MEQPYGHLVLHQMIKLASTGHCLSAKPELLHIFRNVC